MNLPAFRQRRITRLAWTALCCTWIVQHAAAQTESSSPEAETAQASNTSSASDAKESKGILPIPDYDGDLWKRAYLTGDWGGKRTDIANKGIQINVDWTQTLQSIVSGGLETGTKYGGSLDYLINIDLDRMGLVPGGLVKIRAETRYGQSVNNIAGPVLPVDTDGYFPLSDDDIPITVTDLTYYQYLSNKFGLFLGKFDTLDGDPNPFASGRGNTQFINSNFVFNSVSGLTVPYSTLGFGAVYLPTPDIALSTTVMNSDDSSTTSGFENIGDGFTWSSSANFQYRLGKLPGGQNFTFIYAANQDFAHLGGIYEIDPEVGVIIPTQSSTWAVMWSGWQYLWTKDEHDAPVNLGAGPPDIQGIGLFARAGWGDGDTNPVNWSVSAGIGGQGIIPGRDNDRFGIGYYYSGFESLRLTSALGFSDHGQGLEAFYNLAITPATQLTFDIQVIDSFQPDFDTAVILGMRLFMNF